MQLFIFYSFAFLFEPFFEVQVPTQHDPSIDVTGRMCQIRHITQASLVQHNIYVHFEIVEVVFN